MTDSVEEVLTGRATSAHDSSKSKRAFKCLVGVSLRREKAERQEKDTCNSIYSETYIFEVPTCL